MQTALAARDTLAEFHKPFPCFIQFHRTVRIRRLESNNVRGVAWLTLLRLNNCRFSTLPGLARKRDCGRNVIQLPRRGASADEGESEGVSANLDNDRNNGEKQNENEHETYLRQIKQVFS